MPRPAQCCRPAQVDDKTVIAPDLSLRGGQRPTWQSREGSHDFADSLPVIRLGTARLPRRFAPRNDTSGEREVHQCPPAVELLPTGRSLSAATGPVGAVTILTAACANRLCSTGRGMPLPYNGGYHETAAGTGRQSRFRRECPVIRLGTARLPRRFAPRNDKLGGHCFLTLARTSRRCSTGPGCPLPYKARPEACLLFILHFSVFSIHFFTYAPPATACACFA